MNTRYAMALRSDAPSPPSPDWANALAQIPGVTLEGHHPRGAQFTATPEAVAKVRSRFSTHFRIEEVVERRSN